MLLPPGYERFKTYETFRTYRFVRRKSFGVVLREEIRALLELVKTLDFGTCKPLQGTTCRAGRPPIKTALK